MGISKSSRGVVLFGIIAILGQVGLAGAEDMARYMPADTAFYVGYSPFPGGAPCKLDFGPHSTSRLASVLGDDADEQELLWIRMVEDVLAALQAGSVGFGVIDVTVPEGRVDIQAALVFKGCESIQLAEILNSLIVAAGDPRRIEQREVKGVATQHYPLGESGMYVCWGTRGEMFIAALGESAFGRVVDCAGGGAVTLADAAELKFDRQKLNVKADGGHICIYGDAQRMIVRGKEIAAELMGELPPIVDAAITELGLGGYRSKYLHIDEHDGEMRFFAFAHVDGPLKGIFKLWDQQPLTDDDLKVVPKDAYWAEVGNLDLHGLWQEALRVLTALSPDTAPMVEGSLAMTTQVLGFSLTSDLLPAFGDTWAIFDAPDHGGILLTGTVLVAELRDAAALQGMIERAVQLLAPFAAQENINVQLKQTAHGDHTIHYVLIGGIPCPVAPAWGFVGDRWVFGLFPQNVAAAMKQVDPQTRGASLLDHPAYQAARPRLPQQAMGLGYCDSRYFARMFYPVMNLIQTAAVTMLGGGDVDIDLALMPPVAEVVADTTNFVGTSSRDSDGIIYASIGDGTPLTVVVGTTALATSIMLPALARAREITKRAVSASQLRGIGMGCMVYANDHEDEFPAALRLLLEEGHVSAKMLHSPLDPDDDAESYGYIAGQTPDGDPRNVLAFEWPHGDEGTNVLFLDGHVEWMDMERAGQVIRETYERLGRAAEIPVDFRQEPRKPTLNPEP